MSDHVHLYLSVPPKHSISQVVKVLKGKSAEALIKEYPKLLRKKYETRTLWARGYSVTTVGINSATIRNYIINQIEEEERMLQTKIWRDI